MRVLEEAWGAVVVLCARSDTVVEWNHANEDGFSVYTATGAACGGTGQFLMTSMIFGSRSGDIDFVASIKSTDCDEESTFDSNTATCSCPASAFSTFSPMQFFLYFYLANKFVYNHCFSRYNNSLSRNHNCARYEQNVTSTINQRLKYHLHVCLCFSNSKHKWWGSYLPHCSSSANKYDKNKHLTYISVARLFLLFDSFSSSDKSNLPDRGTCSD